MSKFKSIVRKVLPEPLLNLLRWIRSKCFTSVQFIVFPPKIGEMSYFQRLWFAFRLEKVSWDVDCPHTQDEIMSFISSFLSIPTTIKGCVVEAGSYKGGSTAKFSIAAKLANRQLVVFDSFMGIPKNKEPHDKNIFGHSIRSCFKTGSYCGSLEEVQSNIEKYGEMQVCKFIKGWFEDTMPDFSEKICAVYLDIDLASSTRTCLKYLYPLIVPGGVLFSQDGAFPLVVEVFDSNEFWEKEVGCKKPKIEGLGKAKLIKILKPIE